MGNPPMTEISRRELLKSAAGGVAAAGIAAAQAPAIPIIDSHIHLFDQTRPQGAPYSGGGANRDPALPARYRKLAAPLGIVGAIEVEASPWIEDNLWVLEVEERDPIMLGAVGNLQPEKPEFREYLERYHKNKLFRGIRYGNLWGYSLVAQANNPVFIEGLKLLAQADLSLDTANPQPDLLEAVVRVSDKVPELRVIIDHLPAMKERVDVVLRELAKRPRIYVKVSELLKVEGGKAVLDPAAYKAALDYLFETFGEDRLIFGSDWPNGPAVDNLPAILKIVKDYFNTKGQRAAEKYFNRNSAAAYKWVRRQA
jgi:predicted TIM-barrel fold metal-dependent hydrolase